MSRVIGEIEVGPYTFFAVVDHGFSDYKGEILWRFAIDGQKGSSELYPDLDYVMVAAVGQKYTGSRGAGGTGVDTAAGWFMRMIGADLPTRAQLIHRVAQTDAVRTASTHHLCAPEVHAESVVDALKLPLRG